MSRLLRCLAAACAVGLCAPLAAQDASEDCELAERYHTLAQDSLAEYDESAAAGWLERAAEICPRHRYFQQFGEIRMQSLDDAEKAEAVDAFVSAYRLAETDAERAATLFQYATLLNREGDPQHAGELIAEARTLDSQNTAIAELAAAIDTRLETPAGDETVRALGTALYKRLDVEDSDESAGGLRAYPWPPEDPSWRVPIRRDLSPQLRPGMSLIDVEDLLARSLLDAAYSGWSLYSAPGGFVMVTRFEAIDRDGAPLDDAQRYTLPSDSDDFSLFAYVRSLFDAPQGLYRFIAFVVSDETYEFSRGALQESEALRRLRRGANRLPPEYADIEFTDRHTIEALIYEFEKGDGDVVDPVVPGRIPGLSHLRNSGLSDALSR
ncbi:MAG TPA: hypothetical protein VKQ06_06975 [Gammaproteobacteria bacterium]|nr:hypothetical protein [Gammaproteobacteria bacterium]